MDVQKIKIEDVVEKINLLYKTSQERELTEEEKSKCKKNNNTQEIVSFILDNI